MCSVAYHTPPPNTCPNTTSRARDLSEEGERRGPISPGPPTCLFCSVDEGLSSKKVHEMVIEPSYLADECRKIVEFKGCECHLTINSHGEPLLYSAMTELIGYLRQIEKVKRISLFD